MWLLSWFLIFRGLQFGDLELRGRVHVCFVFFITATELESWSVHRGEPWVGDRWRICVDVLVFVRVVCVSCGDIWDCGSTCRRKENDASPPPLSEDFPAVTSVALAVFGNCLNRYPTAQLKASFHSNSWNKETAAHQQRPERRCASPERLSGAL